MVSIIVPVYNIKEYLPDCMNGLLDQTAQDIQILLVDDGSTDGSSALCDRLAAQDARIQVIHKKNGGLSSARNAGLDAAAGEWILFLDGDDYLLPRAVELLLKTAQEHPDADFVQFHYQETPDSSWQPEAVEGEGLQPHVVTDIRSFFERLYVLGGVGASACTKLLRRTLFEDLRFREGLRHEDEELMTRLLPKCNKGIYTALVLYGYRMRPGSIVRSGFQPASMDIFPIMEERIAMLERLGYTELIGTTRKRMFINMVLLYCQARRSGAKEAAKQLKTRLCSMGKEVIPGLSGQYKLLHKSMKITSAAPGVYYLLRRLCGKS